MTPEHLALVAESRSTILTALSAGEQYRKEYRSACLQLSQAANHALSLTMKLERGTSAQQADYAELLEQQMVSVRACQAALKKLIERVTQ